MRSIHLLKNPQYTFGNSRLQVDLWDIEKHLAAIFAPAFPAKKNTFSKRRSLPETNSSHQKIGKIPKGNNRIPTIHF